MSKSKTFVSKYVKMGQKIYLLQKIDNQPVFFNLTTGGHLVSYEFPAGRMEEYKLIKFDKQPTYGPVLSIDELKPGDILQDGSEVYLVVYHNGNNYAINPQTVIKVTDLKNPRVMNENTIQFEKA